MHPRRPVLSWVCYEERQLSLAVLAQSGSSRHRPSGRRLPIPVPPPPEVSPWLVPSFVWDGYSAKCNKGAPRLTVRCSYQRAFHGAKFSRMRT